MELRTRLSLVGRTLLAVCAVGAASVVLLTPVVVLGGVASLGVLAVAVGWLPTGGLLGGRDAFVWQILWTHWRVGVALGGVLTFVGLVLPAAVRELRAFRWSLSSEASKNRHAQLAADDLAGTLAQQAGVPKPEVRVMSDPEPKSYAFGRAEDCESQSHSPATRNPEAR
jgi:Zn-dependent protease with chaperone function